MTSTKEERLKIVNELIKEIALLDRKFFNYEGTIAQLFIRNHKVWYKPEYISQRAPVYEVCLSVPEGNRLRGVLHGGTLKTLLREFKDFVIHGKRWYGSGLNAWYWGYSPEAVKQIQEKAIRLGFWENKYAEV